MKTVLNGTTNGTVRKAEKKSNKLESIATWIAQKETKKHKIILIIKHQWAVEQL